MTLIPYFEVNGNRYEIRRSRFLLCEFEKIQASSKLEDDAGQKLIELQEKAQQLDKLKQRKDDLFDAYLETFSEDAKKLYEQANAEYEKLFEEVMPQLGKNGLLARIKKVGMDNAEKLVIIALRYDERGKEIRSKEEAEDIWCSWVVEVGQVIAQQWLNAFIDCITGDDECENKSSFLAQAKARAEQQAANRKAGLSKIGK